MSLFREHRKYSDSLNAHSGELKRAQYIQSGIYFKGRDRSKKGILQRELVRKREMEVLEEEEAIGPKKRVGSPYRGRSALY